MPWPNILSYLWALEIISRRLKKDKLGRPGPEISIEITFEEKLISFELFSIAWLPELGTKNLWSMLWFSNASCIQCIAFSNWCLLENSRNFLLTNLLSIYKRNRFFDVTSLSSMARPFVLYRYLRYRECYTGISDIEKPYTTMHLPGIF